MTAFRSLPQPRAWLALAAVALASGVADAGPRDPLYRWTDEAGAVRYTTERSRIPVAHRGEAVRVELPPEPEPALPHLGPAETPPVGDATLPPVDASRVPGDAGHGTASSLDVRIEALEREIAADEARLTEHISDPERAARLRSSEEVAAIAERLPRLQAELRTLLEQRDASRAPDAP